MKCSGVCVFPQPRRCPCDDAASRATLRHDRRRVLHDDDDHVPQRTQLRPVSGQSLSTFVLRSVWVFVEFIGFKSSVLHKMKKLVCSFRPLCHKCRGNTAVPVRYCASCLCESTLAQCIWHKNFLKFWFGSYFVKSARSCDEKSIWAF